MESTSAKNNLVQSEFLITEETQKNHCTPVEALNAEEIADKACRGVPEYEDINHLFVLFGDRVSNSIWSRSVPLLCEAYLKDFPDTIYKEAIERLIKVYSPDPVTNKPIDLVLLSQLEFMHQLVVTAFNIENSCLEAEMQIKKLGPISSKSPPLLPLQRSINDYPEPLYSEHEFFYSSKTESLVDYNKRLSLPITEFDSISNFSDASVFECSQLDEMDYASNLAEDQEPSFEAGNLNYEQPHAGGFMENLQLSTDSGESIRTGSQEQLTSSLSSVTSREGPSRSLISSPSTLSVLFERLEGEMAESAAGSNGSSTESAGVLSEHRQSSTSLLSNLISSSSFDVDKLLSDTDTPDSDIPDDASSNFSIPSSVDYGSQGSYIQQLLAQSQEEATRIQNSSVSVCTENRPTSSSTNQGTIPLEVEENYLHEDSSAELVAAPVANMETTDELIIQLDVNEEGSICSFPQEDYDYIYSLVPIFQAKHGDLIRMTNEKFSLISSSMRDQSAIDDVIDSQKHEIDEQSANLIELNNEISILKNLESELSHTIVTLERDLEVHNQSSDELLSQDKLLKERFSNLSRLSEESEKQQLVLSDQIETAENGIKRLTADTKVLQDEIYSLNRQISLNISCEAEIVQLQEEKANLEQVNGELIMQAFASRNIQLGRAKSRRPHIEELFDLEPENPMSEDYESGSALMLSLNTSNFNETLNSHSSNILAKQQQVTAALYTAETQLHDISKELELSTFCSAPKDVSIELFNLQDSSTQTSLPPLDVLSHHTTSGHQSSGICRNVSMIQERQLLHSETSDFVTAHSHASSMTLTDDLSHLNLSEAQEADALPKILLSLDLSWIILFLLYLLLAWFTLLFVHVTLDRYAFYLPKSFLTYIIQVDPFFRGFVSKVLIYIKEYFILANTY